MLIPEGRKKILRVFFEEPCTEIHLRDIARRSGASRNNVDNSMRLFVKGHLFLRKEISNMAFFKPNLESSRLLKMFELLELEKREEFFNKNKSVARLLQKYTRNIVDFSNKYIEMVILFGSVARGEWISGSDIDILAVIPKKNNELTRILDRAKVDVSPLLEIRAVTTTINEVIEGFRKKTQFHEELWKDRIILYNEFIFWQLVEEARR